MRQYVSPARWTSRYAQQVLPHAVYVIGDSAGSDRDACCPATSTVLKMPLWLLVLIYVVRDGP